MALMPVDVALAKIEFGVKTRGIEHIPLAQGVGRVLSRQVVAKRDQPPFAGSAMDGYAIRHEDQNLPLRVIGVSAAGHAFKGRLRAGSAVRIFTGAPMPMGADTVVIQENVRREADVITLLQPVALAKHIRMRGLDFAVGDLLVGSGTVLGPRDLALIAAANVPVISVYRKPRVVLFTTGDELVLPGQKPRTDQIVSSNSHGIAAMAQRFGAEVINLGIVRDNLKATQAAVRKGLSADVLLTTGGASVGDHDFVQEAFRSCGVRIGFWKIAMRPGKPFMYGRKGRCHVMGLPGNPVSAMVTARLFLKPLLARLCGSWRAEKMDMARLDSPLPANDGRQDYIRASLTVGADGSRVATPFPVQDSSMQRTLQMAHALIVREPNAPAAAVGDMLGVLLIDF